MLVEAEGWVEVEVGVVVGIWVVTEELDGLFDVVGFVVELGEVLVVVVD